MDLLSPAPNDKWHSLCLKLDVHPTALDTIRANHDKVEDRLIECLSSWLKKDVIDTNNHPSCTQLADALEKIGHRDKAIHIRNNCDKEIGMCIRRIVTLIIMTLH